jgi:hypothetical protein
MKSLKNYGAWGRVGLLLVLVVSLTPMMALAQGSNTGEIKGTVTDSSGAVVAGAAVSIKNLQTGLVTPTSTNQDGLYDVPFLVPGQYTITYSKQGFRDVVRQGIVLQVETLEVGVTLQLGASTQEVVVTSQAPLVETETTEQSVDLNSVAVQTAPIVGGVWYNSLVQLVPGVNTGGGAGAAGYGNNAAAAGINGTQGYNSNWLMDGGTATLPRDYNPSNNYPPLDAIAEVNINSSNFSAQYGNGVANFNVITKTGSNTWHGSLFEYVQNTAFNARSFYNSTGPKSVEHWNEYGGSVGGPILKNKLFFFFNFQYNPASSPTQGFYSFPTAAMRQGCFSTAIAGFPNTSGSGCPSGTLSYIPTASQDPVAQKLQAYWPMPNITTCLGVTPCLTNNYNYNASIPSWLKWYTGSVEYNINSKQKIGFSLLYDPAYVIYTPDPLYSNAATALASSANPSFPNYNLTSQITWTDTISPTVLNEFRVSETRELDKYVDPSLGKNVPQTLGLEPEYGNNAPGNIFPKISVDSGAGFGGAGLGDAIDSILASGGYSASDIVTLIHGRHTVKIGSEWDREYQNYTNWGDVSSGNFEFNGSITGVPYADFLLGDVYGWYVYDYDATSARMWNLGTFVEDDFKVSSHVTLNLGLRWQIQSGWGVSGDLFGTYDPNLPNPGVAGNPKGAVLFGGQSDAAFGGPTGTRNTIQNADFKEFAPRIGIAWSPSANWSIRASYGVFDNPRDAEDFTDGALGLGFNPHSFGSAQGYVNGHAAFQLKTGPPPGSVIYPTLQTLSASLSNYSSVEYYPLNMPTSYDSEFLLDIQHQIVGGILVDAGYVNTHGTNLNFQTDIDQTPQSELTCTTYNCGNPIPWYTAINAALYNGWSNYNALQIRLQKRMGNGLNFLVNYAWSKTLDTGTGNGHGQGIDIYQNAYSPAANYGLADSDAANTLTGEIVWDLPFGSGRHFALQGVANEVVGGWRVSTLFQWHSGTPFSAIVQPSVAGTIDPGLTPSLNDGSYLFPNVSGNPNLTSPTLTRWFNTAAFTDPTAGTFGNSGRNILIGPGFSDVDFSVGKIFPINVFDKKTNLEIKADITNLFNHPSFGNPGNQLGTTNFGVISSVESGPRTIQLGAHFTF